MRITEAEREVLQKNEKNMIAQLNKSEIVYHFKKEGYKERTKKIARIVPETRQFVLPRFLLRDYGR